MKKIYIDVGSSSIKVYNSEAVESSAYEYSANKLQLLKTISLNLKENFSKKKGQLFKITNRIKKENPRTKIKVIGTSVFRKLPVDIKTKFLMDFKQKTGLTLEIIDQTLENKYLELALMGKAKLNELVLLVNIGGGSTELVIVQNGQTIKKENIDLGVGSINSHFLNINDQLSKISLEEVVNFIKPQLPQLPKTKIAFYTGGELNYMKLASYFLKQNNLFSDPDHPYLIDLNHFIKRNHEIFNQITLQELENLMPDNPKWMHGARACSAFAQAIFEKYGVEIIIPSDSNLINGVIREDLLY